MLFHTWAYRGLSLLYGISLSTNSTEELIPSQSFEYMVHFFFSRPSTWEYNNVTFVVQLRSKNCTHLLLHWLATRKQHFLLSRERLLRVRLLIMKYINSWMNWRLPSYVSDWTLIEWVEVSSDSFAVNFKPLLYFLSSWFSCSVGCFMKY